MDWEERYFWTPRSVVVSSKRRVASASPAPSVSTMASSNQQDAITPIEASNDQATSSAGQKEEVSLWHECNQNDSAKNYYSFLHLFRDSS